MWNSSRSDQPQFSSKCVPSADCAYLTGCRSKRLHTFCTQIEHPARHSLRTAAGKNRPTLSPDSINSCIYYIYIYIYSYVSHQMFFFSCCSTYQRDSILTNVSLTLLAAALCWVGGTVLIIHGMTGVTQKNKKIKM